MIAALLSLWVWVQTAVAAPRSEGLPPAAAISATPGASAAFAEGGCALCHDVPGAPQAARTDSCAGCHIWIRQVAANPAAREKALAIFPKWERYEHNVATYLTVPPLDAAMARLDPDWVEGWLADPHDVRPGLPETMPRLALGDVELRAIADAFAAARVDVPRTAAPSPGNVVRGQELFETRGCTGCHSFGGRYTEAVLPQAPDLAFVGARLGPDMAAAWIRDPAAVSPSATMPALGLGVDEAIAVRDFLLLADPSATAPSEALAAIAPTTEPVTWAEVEDRVFGRICTHCHMKPELNGGRAGPGNAGGFGWAATGIELQTREGVLAVADRIPASILRRRGEAARDCVAPGEAPLAIDRPELPGMPLGLPPLPDEDIALVLGWLEQGGPE